MRTGAVAALKRNTSSMSSAFATPCWTWWNAPELVRHGVAHAEEGVGKGHTGHCGGVRHLLARFHIGLPVLIRPRQVFKDYPQRAYGKAVGVIRRHHGGVGLKRVGHGVYTGGCGETLGRADVQVGIDYRHLRHQLIVGERVLLCRCARL